MRKIKTKGRLLLLGALLVVTQPHLDRANAWGPSGGEESRLFNQLVTEQLKFKPQTPIKNWRGQTVGWRGPTYQQQWNWEYQRQLNQANSAERTRNSTIRDSTREMQKLEKSLENDKQVANLKTKQANAQARVNFAQTLQPDGPTQIEMTERLGNIKNAGGRLDANKDGVISEAEMKAALATRVSMQRTQYDDEKKLNVDGNNDIAPSETRRGLMEVAGVGVLDHNKMLDDAKKDKSFKETDIGKENRTGTYVDSEGKTKRISGLTPTALKSDLTAYTSQKNAYANSRDNDKMTATELRNGQLPTTTHRYAEIKTTGTWGTTRSWSGSWDAGGGINRNTSQIQSQMANPNAGNNNAFYNRTQASTTGFRGANANARANVANAQRLQNSTTGFRSVQPQVQAIYNSINTSKK